MRRARGSGDHAARHVDTPAFMPVGTKGTVKGLLVDQVEATGAQVILGNTYHLMIRPGAERVAKLGGLHGFSGWPHTILTDSGGFRVFSLASASLSARAVQLQDNIDGGGSLFKSGDFDGGAECAGRRHHHGIR